MMKELRHPNVVQVLDWIELGERCMTDLYVMEPMARVLMHRSP
jgi:hypothetical protein